MALNVFGCPISSLPNHKDIKSNEPSDSSEFHSYGIWTKASYINHDCLGNVRRSFIGDMMIIRATKDLDTGTELTFPYQDADGHYTSRLSLEQEFKSWNVVCECILRKDMEHTKHLVATPRHTLWNQMKNIRDSSIGVSILKLEQLLKELNDTYARPAEEVPRLLLWDPQLLLARLYMTQSDHTKGLDAIGRKLYVLGFTVVGLNLSSKAFEVVTWDYLVDHFVEVFLHARLAFEKVKLADKAAQADRFAWLAYCILVGGGAMFDQMYPTWR
jgi:hypothetical protein